MANIKLNLTANPFTGQIVTFVAPCDCDQVADGLLINGEVYTVYDAAGKCVTGVAKAWVEGAIISVALDCEHKKAFIQATPVPEVPEITIADVVGLQEVLGGVQSHIDNQNNPHKVTAAQIGAAASSHTHAISDISGLTSLLGEYGQIATGSYTGTGTYGASNPNSITCPFVPRVFVTGVLTGSLTTAGSFLMYVEGIEDASQYWSINGNTVSWYTSATNAGAANQCNAKNAKYYWFAIG